MPHGRDDAPARAPFDVWLYRVALGALLVVSLARWPMALTFSDEVGYLGQARLVLSGHISPTASDPGVSERLDGGRFVSRYPLFVPLLVAPLLAIHPRLVFVLGVASFAAIICIAGRILKRWRHPPQLALLFTIHPTFVLLGYTSMIDLFVVAAAFAAFELGERGRRLAGLAYALLVLAKPIGLVIAGGLLLGAAVGRWSEQHSLRAALRKNVWSIVGIGTGGVAAAGLNWLSWGHLGYSYDVLHARLGNDAVFSLAYLPRNVPGYILSLLVVLPGLLIIGPLGLWRRKCHGPLFVSAGLMAMMAIYFFVDRGRNRIEDLVLMQRLVLPASAFFILGYADVLAPIFKARRMARPLSAALVFASLVVVFWIGTRLRGWHQDAHDSYRFARDELARKNDDVLGTTESAMKAALMYQGPVILTGTTARRPPVIICNLASGSYRFDKDGSCAFPGYETVAAYGTFRVLEENRP